MIQTWYKISSNTGFSVLKGVFLCAFLFLGFFSPGDCGSPGECSLYNAIDKIYTFPYI
jgi:hypothetical protein